MIQSETNKFCRFLAQIESWNESGKTLFQLDHCRNILRNEVKWLNLRDNVKVHARQPATQSCPTFAGSTNLD